jgi:hypothetical protein
MELDALWYHLEEMCDRVEPPLCYSCGKAMELVPPDMLYYSCREWPEDFDWRPVKSGDIL